MKLPVPEGQRWPLPYLYPTTFRWNEIAQMPYRRFVTIYIPLRSDETQLAIVRRDIYYFIYIPLRSDETHDARRIGRAPTLFISHYVQMKLGQKLVPVAIDYDLYPTTFRWNCVPILQMLRRCRIYIPLRSDETLGPEDVFLAMRAYLYPTTFRWNAGGRSEEGSARTDLYPTTFRWNPLPVIRTAPMGSNLYPTTFRWNLESADRGKSAVGIYIPLRSDETIIWHRQKEDYYHLYPTTFRWNWSIHQRHLWRPRIYIPLRSDETWRAASTCSAGNDIYIPLRSDETGFQRSDLNLVFQFISHYVQMKPAPRHPHGSHGFKFISHYVQMKLSGKAN